MSDFADTPFVAGSLTGSRAFAVDKYGRLTSVILGRAVWTPGENTARCMQPLLTWQREQAFSFAFTSAGKPLGSTERPEPPKPADDHRPGKLGCQCGFYAYFDGGTNSYLDEPGRILGIIEGFGLATVGDRGFRAEKAIIKALVIKPKQEGAFTARVRANYPDIPVFDRKRDALDAFPLTPPALPSPLLDLDFWTREAL